MRIAQVAPLVESVPPPGYGGTERVVSYLTEELVREGHDVTLFASGDSQTARRARRLHAAQPADWMRPSSIRSPTRSSQLEAVAAQSARFDIVHWHVDYFHFPMSRRLGVPNVTTLHGRLDIPDLSPVYDEFGDMPVVSISDDQRAAAAARELGGDRPPRHAAGRARAALRSPASTSPSSVASRPRSGPTGRSRSRAAPGCRSASPPRSTTWTANTSRRRSSRSSTPTT